MISAEWQPKDAEDFMKRWEHATLPHDGHVDQVDAQRLQVVFAQMAEELGDLVAQAQFTEEQYKFKFQNSKSIAFLQSNAKSDRQREADAAQSVGVKAAEMRYIEARAYRKLIENRYESAVRSHHSMKSLVGGQEKMKWA